MKLFFSLLTLLTLIASPLKAVDNSLFLGTVGPQEAPNDGDSFGYQIYRFFFVNPFVSTYLEPTTQVFTPPPGDLVDDVVVPAGAQVRAYFLFEEAGFSNQFGFIEDENFDLTDPANANSLIFEHIDSLVDPAGPANNNIVANDYVEIYSSAPAETTLDFFLIPDGADASPVDGFTEHRFFTDETENVFSEEHILIVQLPSIGIYDYYFIAAEDLLITGNLNMPGSTNPGDFPVDYADLFTVLQVKNPMGNPEPSTYFILGSFLLGLMWKKKRDGLVKT